MGKSSSVDAGTWYLVAFHDLLGYRADALLELQVEDQTAWKGEVTESSVIDVDALNVLGGEKDQGGVQGPMAVWFGDATQTPDPYLTTTFGDHTAAWRGFTTIAWRGGKWGANNPYMHKQSYKARFIKRMWEGGCWYEEKAQIGISGSVVSPMTLYYDLIAFSVVVPGYKSHVWVTATFSEPSASFDARFEQSSELSIPEPLRAQIKTVDGELIWDTGWVGDPADQTALDAGLHSLGLDDLKGPITAGPVNRHIVLPAPISALKCLRMEYGLHGGHAGPVECKISFGLPGSDDRAYAMNPVHILYYLQTQPGRGAEPTANMADDNLKAAADWYYAQGFGLCGTRKAVSVSPADYIRQIEKVAGCAFVRSPVDGKWYCNISNGEYDLDSLPILTDDDVLSFKEIPTVLNEAINSVSVKYFDPVRKLSVTTAPVRALALIAAFGERRQTLDYPEIPTAELANRVALRELLSFITPTRKFELDTKTTTNGYLRGQYFRLQLPKRGIADMVCEVGEIEYGTLASGGNRLKAVQDTVRFPDAAYVGIDRGIDTRPSQTPLPIVIQRLFEAPYIEVCQRLSRADLDALPDDAGYLVAVAVDPASSRDFTLRVAPDGGAYGDRGYGDFCPTATLVDAIGYMDTGPLALANAKSLASVHVGDPVLLNDELCRVDAIDATALTITLGRGCADTVPAHHAAGTRLYFYTDHRAYDTTERTDGELVHAKLLTNTGSAQLAEDAATALDLTFAGRQARPYPPAHVQINGEDYPPTITGDAVITWAHRDRLTQADQLVDQLMATIGPETGTTYTVRAVDETTDTETHNHSGITGTTYTVPATDLTADVNRIEVYSVRDGLESLWRVQIVISVGSVLLDETGAPILTEDGDYILME